ncbi:MAG: phosphatase PAP2 family protein [Rickettsiales bacterium]|jgi:membrane-associated phospholipid phosphatase|nr:phosphatase PAP2 family protein [Rickettsiales bacterium]
MKNKLMTIFIAGAITATGFSARASEVSAERIGDLLQVALPAYALGLTMQEEDWDGTLQFAKVFAASTSTEIGIKYFVNQERPNGANVSAFPSGHTMAAFSAATFIHRRYGLYRAALPYALATFVGYSRVQSKWHTVDDVVAGAVFAGLWTMAFAERKMPPITVSADTHGAKLNFHTRF